jgi:hypothetical protein
MQTTADDPRLKSNALRLAAAAGLLAMLLGGFWWVSCPDTLTYFEWKYRYRVHEGMTLAEVEAVLGPGQPDREDGEGDVVRPGEAVRIVDTQTYSWHRGRMRIRVDFRGGRVASKGFTP